MKIILKCVLLLFLILFLLPILSVFGLGTLGFLGRNASELNLVAQLSQYLGETALVLFGTAAWAMLLGVGLAWLLSRYTWRGAGFWGLALLTPLAFPGFIAAYANVELWQFAGPVQTSFRALGFAGRLPDIRSPAGAVWVMGLALFPYVFVLARTAFEENSQNLVRAAQTLGASPLRAWCNVVLPLAWPAIALGMVLVMMETLADFGAASYFGVQTLTVGIYKSWFAYGDKPAAAGLTTCLLIFCLLLLKLESRWRKRSNLGVDSNTGRAKHADAASVLRGAHALAAHCACALVFAAGFALPLGALFWRWFNDADATLNAARLLHLTGNTVWVASLAAGAVLLVSVVFAYANRFSAHDNKILRLTTTLSRLGYAVPGAVIALALLWPIAALDRSITSLLGQENLWLTGSIAALVYAYTLRFFAVGFSGIQGGLSRIPHSLDAAARTLGDTPVQLVRRVHAPLMKRSTLAAFALVWIDCVKELPATLMLRPFDFDTLAVAVYQLAADERPAEAVLPALVIVAVGLLPVLVMSRLRQSR